MIKDLFVASWSPNRIPTSEERGVIQRLLEEDTQSILRMEKELERLARCAERRTAAIENYAHAETLARELREVFLTKHNHITITQKRLATFKDALPHGNSEDESHIARMGVLKTLGTLKKDYESQLLECDFEIDALDTQVVRHWNGARTERGHLNGLEESQRSVAEWITLREADIAFKKDVLSVRRVIPVEIWEEIFKTRMLEDQALVRAQRLMCVPQLTALQLSAVCRYWRSIVSQYSVLWQHVAIPHHDKITVPQRDRILHYKARLGALLPKVYTYHNDIVGGEFPIPLLSFIQTSFGVKYESLEVTDYRFSILRGPNLYWFLEKLRPQATQLTVHARRERAWRIRSNYGKRFELPLHMLSELREVKGIRLGISFPTALPSNSALPTINLSTLIVRDTAWRAADIQLCFNLAKGIERFEMTNITIDPLDGSQRVNAPSLRSIKCEMKNYPTLQTLIDTPNVTSLELMMETMFDPNDWLNNNSTRLVSKNVKSLRLDGWDSLKMTGGEDTESIEATSRILEAILPKFPDITSLTLVRPRMVSCLDVLATYSAPLAQLQTMRLLESEFGELLLRSFRARHRLLHKRHVEVICGTS